MKTEFENSIRRLSFLFRLRDIKIAWVNPCIKWYLYAIIIIRITYFTVQNENTASRYEHNSQKKLSFLKIIDFLDKFLRLSNDLDWS